MPTWARAQHPLRAAPGPLPRRAHPILSRGRRRDQRVHRQHAADRRAGDGVARMMSGISSPARPWFRLRLALTRARQRGHGRAARGWTRCSSVHAACLRQVEPLQLPAHALWRARHLRHRGSVDRRGRGGRRPRLYADGRRVLAREQQSSGDRHALPLRCGGRCARSSTRSGSRRRQPGPIQRLYDLASARPRVRADPRDRAQPERRRTDIRGAHTPGTVHLPPTACPPAVRCGSANGRRW